MTPFPKPIADYYSEKVSRFGATPQGADWNGAGGQVLRFSVLMRLLGGGAGIPSLDDYGCGYGALMDYLRANGPSVDYLGVDAAARMVEEARRAHPGDEARFVEGTRSPRRSLYAVASGIFNVRLGIPDKEWEDHVVETLDAMNRSTTHGFAFNCLSTRSDPLFGRLTCITAIPASIWNCASSAIRPR